VASTPLIACGSAISDSGSRPSIRFARWAAGWLGTSKSSDQLTRRSAWTAPRRVPLCMESSTPFRDTARAMPQESLEDFIRWPFIAEPAHAQTAPL
jgi:hypothetical protein